MQILGEKTIGSIRHWTLASLLAALVAAPLSSQAAEPLRLNQVQTIGTHNSYHVRDVANAKRNVEEWNYNHPPLDVQLDRGVRSFELDLHYKSGEFEVFHVPLLDEGTTCRKLADALATVRRWSEAHPRHVPISFLFELKKEGPGLDQRIKHIDAEGFDRLDAALRVGFADGQIITPDSVRGQHATLREAVTSAGWPVLDECRGKVLFILHDNGAKRELYTDGHPSLRGRVMFVRSDESRDDGATLVLDNPRDPDIPRLARAGFFIRTRADANLKIPGSGQPARRDAAFASGAQILSTDFPSGQPDPATGYVVEFPNHAPARVNPVNGPTDLGETVGE
ncbi:MAG: Ca2+-dependent phosphoinositide-specific phospholipase C [Pirellulales bacterium]